MVYYKLNVVCMFVAGEAGNRESIVAACGKSLCSDFKSN